MATYTVKSGDNLSKIASANGVSLAALEAANPQLSSNYNLIQIGSSVNLPSTNSSSTTTTPTTTTPTTTTPAKTTSTTTTPSTSSNNSTPQVEFTTQYGNVYQGATVSNANGRITWTNPDGSTVWLSSDTNTYPNNAQYIQQYAPQYYTAPASSTSSTSSSSNSNAGLSPDVATLGLQMANIGSQAALAAGYSATDVPQYDSNGKIIPKSQAPAPVTTTPATTTTPASTQPQSSFSAVTGENMANGVYSTGNAQLDSILLGAQSALNTMIAGGQVINPNIALSPNDITIFLNQAKSIVDPDFANQISQVQQVLSQNLTQLQTQYENEQQYDNQQFQKSLSQSREASVGAGYGGSERTMSDLLQTQEEQQSLNTLQNQTQSSAQNLVNTAAQSIGSSNVNTLPFNTYTATNQGLGGVNQSGQLSYAPINVTQGSLEAQQQGAESTQATQLAAQELKNRALNLYPTT